MKYLKILLVLCLFVNSLLADTIYIDPTYTGSVLNGTINQPYKSWSSITFKDNNTYLQKINTIDTISQSIFILEHSNIVCGTYGSSSVNYAYITNLSSNNVTFY